MEHNGEWSGDGPSSPKRSPDPHVQTVIQTRGEGDEPNGFSHEDGGVQAVPVREVCEEGGSLKRLLRFDGAEDEHSFQCSDKLFDQQLEEESGELNSELKYTHLR